MITVSEWRGQQTTTGIAQAAGSFLAEGKKETAKTDSLTLSGNTEEILYAEYPDFKKTYEDVIRDKTSARMDVPYSALEKDGIINYNGVIFQCDEKRNAICLGDMTNEDNVLTIPLSGGGSLKVNRDNIDQLSKAIGMFSPEDVNRIMRAIAQDNKARAVQNQIEEDKAGIGKSAEAHIDQMELS